MRLESSRISSEVKAMKKIACVADEAVRLGRGVEDRRQLVHQRDDADREPGEVPVAALGVAQEVLLAHRDHEDRDDDQVEDDEDGGRHARARASKSASSAATPVTSTADDFASVPAEAAGSTQRVNP